MELLIPNLDKLNSTQILLIPIYLTYIYIVIKFLIYIIMHSTSRVSLLFDKEKIKKLHTSGGVSQYEESFSC